MSAAIRFLPVAASAALLACGCATTPPALCRNLPKLITVTADAPDGSRQEQLTFPDDTARILYLQCRAELGVQSAEVEMARLLETGDGVP